MKNRVLLTLFVLAFYVPAKAEKVEFPESELAQESVLPLFEPHTVLKKRRVPSEGRFEIGAMVGSMLNEPFYNPLTAGADIGYNFNNYHSAHFRGSMFSSSISSYGDQLKSQNLNFAKGVTASYMYLGTYEFSPYYGKISLAKNGVVNISIYFSGSVGMMGFSDSSSSMIYSVGLGQKFFFTPNFGIVADLMMMMYDGPDLLKGARSQAPNSGLTGTPYQKQTIYNTLISLGAVFMLPTL